MFQRWQPRQGEQSQNSPVVFQLRLFLVWVIFSHFTKISQKSLALRNPIHLRNWLRFQSKLLSHTWSIFLISPSKPLQLKFNLGQRGGKNLSFLLWLHLPSLPLAWQYNRASSKVLVPFHWRSQGLKTKTRLTSHLWSSLPDLCCDTTTRKMKNFYCLCLHHSVDKEIILFSCTLLLL